MVLTVRELAEKIVSPSSIEVFLDTEQYELVSTYTEKLDERMLTMLGDYVIEDIKANEPDKYCFWILSKPVKASDLK